MSNGTCNMKTEELIALYEAARKYTDLIKFMSSSEVRNVEWDLIAIEAVLRDFHFKATPAALVSLFSRVQELQAELDKLRSDFVGCQRELANVDDVMAASGSCDVITLPAPETLMDAEGNLVSGFTLRALTEHMKHRGFMVKGASCD